MEDLTYFDYLFLISFMPILVQFDPQTVVVIDEQSMVVLSRLFFFLWNNTTQFQGQGDEGEAISPPVF